jgi:hypothetical protein
MPLNKCEVAENRPEEIAETTQHNSALETELGKKLAAQTASSAWNVGKTRRAIRMLEKGMSPAQVGRELCLNVAEVEQLAIDAEDIEPAMEVEPFEVWKQRAAERITRKTVGMMERHLDGVELMTQEAGVLGPETMATVKDASAINYLWLKKGDEGTKSTVKVDFTVLANAQRPPQDGTRAIDITSERVG